MKEEFIKPESYQTEKTHLTIEEINQIYFNKLVSYLMYECGSSLEEAKDSAQYAIIRFTEYMNTVERGKESAYLKKIAKNHFIRSNSGAVAKVTRSFTEKDINVIRLDNDPEKEMIEADEINFLKKCIDKLPVGYKSVVEKRLEGKSHEEIAEELGIEVSTSRSQLTKAIGFLKKIYRKEGELI